MLCYDRRHSCLSPEQISDPSYHLFMHELLKNNNKIELTKQFLRNARVSIPVLFIDPPVYIFPVKSIQNITKTKQYDFLIFCINEYIQKIYIFSSINVKMPPIKVKIPLY